MGIAEALWENTTQCAIIRDLAEALHVLSDHPADGALVGIVDARPKFDPGNKIAGYYQAVADPHAHSFTLTFCVLSAMYLFPECRAEVEQSTPANYIPYFGGDAITLAFEARFERHLAGSETHQAKTPAEIVIAERQLLMAM